MAQTLYLYKEGEFPEPPDADDGFFIQCKSTLICVPSHLHGQWADEFAKFTGSKYKLLNLSADAHLKKITVRPHGQGGSCAAHYNF